MNVNKCMSRLLALNKITNSDVIELAMQSHELIDYLWKNPDKLSELRTWIVKNEIRSQYIGYALSRHKETGGGIYKCRGSMLSSDLTEQDLETLSPEELDFDRCKSAIVTMGLYDVVVLRCLSPESLSNIPLYSTSLDSCHFYFKGSSKDNIFDCSRLHIPPVWRGCEPMSSGLMLSGSIPSKIYLKGIHVGLMTSDGVPLFAIKSPLVDIHGDRGVEINSIELSFAKLNGRNPVLIKYASFLDDYITNEYIMSSVLCSESNTKVSYRIYKLSITYKQLIYLFKRKIKGIDRSFLEMQFIEWSINTNGFTDEYLDYNLRISGLDLEPSLVEFYKNLFQVRVPCGDQGITLRHIGNARIAYSETDTPEVWVCLGFS